MSKAKFDERDSILALGMLALADLVAGGAMVELMADKGRIICDASGCDVERLGAAVATRIGRMVDADDR